MANLKSILEHTAIVNLKTFLEMELSLKVCKCISQMHRD